MPRLARLLVCALSLAACCLGWAAGTYKWVDDNGVVHYSDTLPPQYTNKANTQLNKRGLAVKKTDAALTETQIKTAEAERTQRAEELRQDEEERKRNQLLLDTFVSEHEIDLSRDRALEGPEGRIKLASDRMKVVLQKQEELQTRLKAIAANQDRGARPVPAALSKSLEDLKVERKRLESSIALAEKEKTEIAARFEADKLRFRDLKAGKELVRAAIPDKPTEGMVKTCFDLWYATLTTNLHERAYLVGSEISRAKEPAELLMDVRSRDRFGRFFSIRASCPLRNDGSVDAEGTSARTARYLASKP